MANRKVESKLLKIRNDRIVKEFEQLVNQKEHGVQKLNLDFIYTTLEQKFFIERNSISKIVKGTYAVKQKTSK